MSTPTYKSHPLLEANHSMVVGLPAPSTITVNWNWGSILGLCLMVQVMTGLLLAMHYTAESGLAFEVVNKINTDISYGWLLRSVHANGGSVFFLVVYLHIGRGLYYGSFYLSSTWWSGVILLFILMAAAFLGYVLPWGQMSFWGATVITNLISAVPYLGQEVVYWLWGGFAVGGATLTRFFTFHFLMPFVLLAMVGLHLIALHETGSSNPLGVDSNLDKIPFHPYFSSKDLLGMWATLVVLGAVSLLSPWLLGDTQNFLPADPMITPVHIKPEWYFLFAYAILRAVPNKLGGVVALVLSIAVLAVLPLSASSLKGVSNNPLRKTLFWVLVGLFIILTWIGGNSVEDPYITIGGLGSLCYFGWFIVFGWMSWCSVWVKLQFTTSYQTLHLCGMPV